MPAFAIRREVFGLTIYLDSRDHPFAWYASREELEQAENIADTLSTFHGLIWDVGANAGIYSLRMASLGNPVVAFDISPKAIAYIQRSASRNGLTNIVGVPRAFSLTPVRYRAPNTAIAGNRLSDADGGDRQAITYQEAAAQYGIPTVIKMDIEGHEEAFLKSSEFKTWLVSNQIALVVELHRPEFWNLIWSDMNVTKLHPQIALVQPGMAT
ncbi:MAG: FkbM family methyltransferase [Lentisphaerae bacterium]|nr:FkbM family methyltransferase [Lentisphaerota bacterium]